MGGGGQRTAEQVVTEVPTPRATATTPTARTSNIPLTEEGRNALPFQQQPQQQQQQQPQATPPPSTKPLPRTPARNIYEKRDVTPFWDAPLIVAIAANVVWPAALLVLTMWSMLVVLYFRLTRFLTENLLRTPAVHVHDGDDAPVDMGLYFFGLDNRCEKWLPTPPSPPGYSSIPPSSSTSSFFRGTKKNKSATDLPIPKGHCKFFDPNKPTVIYVHGFSRRTTARRFRETFNWSNNDKQYGLDINAADRWVREGWNIGIFFWNNHADEEMPQDTESKIWTSNGRCGMRYRTICPKKGHVTFYASSRPSSSISQKLANLLTDVFRGSRAPYRLVGHSLGTQLVVHATTLLSLQKDREQEEATAATAAAAAAAATAAAVAGAGIAATRAAREGTYLDGKERKKAIKAAKRAAATATAAATAAATATAAAAEAAQKAPLQLPTRICLLDAFATLGVKAYLSGWPIMMVVQREVVALRDLGIVFEQYQTSMIGRRGLLLRHLTAFVQLDPPDIPWYRLRARHVAAVHMYFLSFGHSIDGPKLKKADLRRHQSAEICFSLINGKGGSLATGLSGMNGSNAESSSSSNSSSNARATAAASCIGLPALAAKAAASPSSFTSSLRASASLSLLNHRKSQNKLILEMDLQDLLQPPLIEDDESPRPRPNSILRRTTTSSSNNSIRNSSSSSSSSSGSPPTVGFSAILRRHLPPRKSSALSNSNLSTLQESMPLLPPAIAIPPPLPPAAPSATPALQHQQQQGGRQRHERFSPRAYDGHNMNHFRWLKPSSYREVEVGDFPLMARASDAEVRELMKCNYVYKQYQGHLFLRVSRAW